MKEAEVLGQPATQAQVEDGFIAEPVSRFFDDDIEAKAFETHRRAVEQFEIGVADAKYAAASRALSIEQTGEIALRPSVAALRWQRYKLTNTLVVSTRVSADRAHRP